MNRGRRNPNQNFNNENVENINNSVKMQRQQSGPGTPAKMPSTPQQQPNTQPKVLRSILKKDAKPPTIVSDNVQISVKQPSPPPTPEICVPEKVEQVEDAPNNGSTESVEMSEESTSAPRKPFFKKIFGGVRKKPSIRAKERKIRQNRHLRKVILPKNALMALYEIKGIQIGDFIINTNMEGGFTALVTVNGCQYEANGNSKSNAKTNACEKALRDYIIKKMMQRPRTQSLSEPMDTSESNDVPNGEESTPVEEADDVPMVNLASFALYKLYTAWENEGFHVPEFHSNAPSSNQANNSQGAQGETVSKKSLGRNELPPNWESMHPATLLCIMRPRLSYTDSGKSGDLTNPIQTVKVTVDDQEFIGTGRSKKIARKNVAIAVCNTLFNTNFPVDE